MIPWKFIKTPYDLRNIAIQNRNKPPDSSRDSEEDRGHAGYLTVGQASEILSLSHHSVYKLCRKGELDYRRVEVDINSTRWFVTAESVEKFKSRKPT